MTNISRALRYAVYDWTREMPGPTRALAMAGLFVQGYAIWAGFSRSLVWPATWPETRFLFLIAIALYFVGYCLQNVALTSEFIRKTQLESDQLAAAQIQRTLQPERIESPSGYDIESRYQPFRVVGGDYFDVFELPGRRTFFVVADVSGKGMAAALLAANIQALVRSLSAADLDLSAIATQINRHLCRHSPANRFATAVFVELDQDSGDFTYVNAGHNPPVLVSPGSPARLDPTGLALGWFSEARYEAGSASLTFGSSLLMFTDGLADAIPGSDPEARLRDALSADRAGVMARVLALADTRLIEDDVTVLLVTRHAAQS